MKNYFGLNTSHRKRKASYKICVSRTDVLKYLLKMCQAC